MLQQTSVGCRVNLLPTFVTQSLKIVLQREGLVLVEKSQVTVFSREFYEFYQAAERHLPEEFVLQFVVAYLVLR